MKTVERKRLQKWAREIRQMGIERRRQSHEAATQSSQILLAGVADGLIEAFNYLNKVKNDSYKRKSGRQKTTEE